MPEYLLIAQEEIFLKFRVNCQKTYAPPTLLPCNSLAIATRIIKEFTANICKKIWRYSE